MSRQAVSSLIVTLPARGVTLVGGTWISDREAFRAALTTGASWTAASRKVAIRREDYPGFEALIERL